MSGQPPESGQTTALVLVGLILLAIPAGLSMAQGLTAPSTTSDTVVTPTVPLINLTDTPTVTPSPTSTESPTPTANGTATPTASPTASSGGGGNASGDGQRHVVVGGSGVAGGVTSKGDCSNATYTTIQAAVDAAEPGDTVLVCKGTYPEHVEVTTADLTIKADGHASIENADESAVWINASGVTVQGFDISVGDGADYAFEVGGQNTRVRNNIVESSEGGAIFLSDGSTPIDGNSDFELGTATGSRIVNNTVRADKFRIWADADQAIIRDNRVSNQPPNDDPSAYPYPVDNASIVSSGNRTLIRNNTIRYDPPPTHNIDRVDYGIQIGLGTNPKKADSGYDSFLGPNRGAGHNWAEENLVVDNDLTNTPAGAIRLHTVATGTNVKNNSIFYSGGVINVWSSESVVQNNNIVCQYLYGPGVNILGNAMVIENDISDCGPAVNIYGHAFVKNNTLHDNSHGVRFQNSSHPSKNFTDETERPSGRVVGNEIIDNGKRRMGLGKAGITIDSDVGSRQIEIHRNFINNNQDLGINNKNKSIIVNATNNIWACGGPSSGFDPLADPYTGRLANGSGDAISGSDEEGISNVHFDPFLVRSGCPTSGQTPTPTATPTPTPTPTPSPVDPSNGDVDNVGQGTSTAAGTGDGSGDGGGAGTGDGSGDGGGADGDAPSGGGANGADGGDTATPQPTPTATRTATPPPTPTPSDTPTPTPVVEPGFGVLTWFVGVAILVSLVALRRRTAARVGERND